MGGFVQAQRGLGKIADALGVGQFQIVHVFQRLHQIAALRYFTQRADHFVMILVSDQDDAEAVARETHRFQMHFGDQRTRGVDHVQAALLGLAAYFGRHAVRAENRPRAGRYFVEFLDKHRARGAQLLHHVLVMHNFLADINRRAVQIERNLHYVDSPDDAGAETTRLEQKDLLVRAVVRCERLKRHRGDWDQL